MLRTKELLDAAEVGKLLLRWVGPFPVAAVARVVRIAPNRAAAPRDSRFGQNERLGDSAIR